MTAVLCLLELDGANAADASLRALSFARSMASSAGAAVTAVTVGGPDGAGPGPDKVAGQLAGFGVTELRTVSGPGLAGYAPAAWARGLQQLADSIGAAAVVAAATDRGSEVLAHLGAMTALPVAANCVSAEFVAAAAPGSSGGWQLVRQRWAGSLLEDALLEVPCALLTVATDALAEPDQESGLPASERPRVSAFAAKLDEADLRVQATESAELGGGLSLATARVVVGGGRGVGGPDGFAPLEELAGLLGGVLGVSRVVTSQGWRPHRQQVGQTGTKISPELYLACGISGAIQHMAGCLSARHIVVVNTDPNAPIMSHADYAVIGDLGEVIPALVAAIKAR
jgi:electron transfer flavoprotein alpha subunit